MPTALLDLADEVYTFTNKSELEAETLLALRTAVRNAHTAGHFWRDLGVVPVTGLSTLSAPQTFSIASKLPRFRQLHYIKTATTIYDAISPKALLDEYGQFKLDVYYALGDTVSIRPATLQTEVEVGYFQHPLITPTEVTSWIVDDYRELIIAWAATSVLTAIGEKDIARRVEQLASAGLRGLIGSNTVVEE